MVTKMFEKHTLFLLIRYGTYLNLQKVLYQHQRLVFQDLEGRLWVFDPHYSENPKRLLNLEYECVICQELT